MIKKGFTLAEVLITLSIVGVIAAVTLPTFVSNTTKAQIGPKLGKAVAMLEQANKALLDEYNVDLLVNTGLITPIREQEVVVDDLGREETRIMIQTEISRDYPIALGGFLNLNESNGQVENIITTKDGVQYTFRDDNALGFSRVGFVDIDINGPAGPDRDATDIFHFSLRNNGTLAPQGAAGWEDGMTLETNNRPVNGMSPNHVIEIVGAADRPGGPRHWETQCPVGEIPPNPAFCAGHIFANNMKVLYK